MRRRTLELDPPGSAPLRLRRYNPRDWPARPEQCHPECAYWMAREQWSELHDDDDSFGLLAEGPDEPFHQDELDRMVAGRPVRRAS